MSNLTKTAYSVAKPDPIKNMKKWMCVICGLIYDEAKGWPDDGIAPGTAWVDVPDDWICPDCFAEKEDFRMVEI